MALVGSFCGKSRALEILRAELTQAGHEVTAKRHVQQVEQAVQEGPGSQVSLSVSYVSTSFIHTLRVTGLNLC